MIAPVEITNLGKRYGKKEVLQSVDLTVQQGEVFALLGASGSGKTTMIRQMIGMERPTEGTVCILGEVMPAREVLPQIGYTAQADALYNELSAEEHAYLFCELYGVEKSKWAERMTECFDVVDLTSERKTVVGTFSGGMKRRLSLALSLLHEPSLLILDEPTVGMDPLLRHRIWQSLRALAANGTTIFLTTHVMDEAEKCDRLALLHRGRIIAQGNLEELYETTGVDSLEAMFLTLGGAR
ncbi:MAG: ABC transporter ATP-binding protein [Bacilli bacterium]